MEGDDVPHAEIGRYIGMAERALYVFAWYFGQLEFIAVWLALKAVMEWKESTDAKGPKMRARFNLFVLGTALSLLVTVVILLVALPAQHAIFRHLLG